MLSNEADARTSLLIGKKLHAELKESHTLIVGLGGVGAQAAEMIVRAGIQNITLVDGDTIHPTNINRQLIALNSTLGKSKVDILSKRLLDINPSLHVKTIHRYIRKYDFDDLFESVDRPDVVIDAIDTLAPKVQLIRNAFIRSIPIVSSMGSAGKLDPTLIQLGDISESHGDRLAYYVRKLLHRYQIYRGVTCIFSPEKIAPHAVQQTDAKTGKASMVGSISYMPNIFGCFAASAAVQTLLKKSDLKEDS